mgnify:CR=1 FL=1
MVKIYLDCDGVILDTINRDMVIDISIVKNNNTVVYYVYRLQLI